MFTGFVAIFIFPTVKDGIVTSIYFFYKAWIYHISHLFFNYFLQEVL